MPFDILQLTRFAGQLGLAIAGAAALWGSAFHLNGTRSSGDTYKAFFLLERLMLPQFLIGFSIFLASWFLGSTFFFPLEAAAHEGIRIIPSPAEITAGYHAAAPLVAALIIVTLLSSSVMKFSGSRFVRRHFGKTFLVQFLLVSGIMALMPFAGAFGDRQAFFGLHNWHSILTLGTVLTVDFLYLATYDHHLIKKTLYRFFPSMSAAILVGLGIDFLSNLTIMDEAYLVTPQFLFSQTVVGIIIVNGALLSGKISAAMIDSLDSGSSPFFSSKFRTVVRVSGAASVVSWLAITFVDFFVLPFSYTEMMLVYLLAIAGAIAFERVFEKLLKKTLGHLIPASAG